MGYTCVMHPDVHQPGPGNCPKCGMALEPEAMPTPAPRTEYTCPMHPQIVRDRPGNCPICGMALEPRDGLANETNPELVDMTRRFWIGVVLTLPLLAVMVSDILPAHQGACSDGLSSRLRPQWFYGQVGHFSSEAGSPWFTAARICLP
jgi:Cu+-exporting ATPase